jgi:FMN phosphatase YigB (HAD superfamily)
MGEPRIFWDLSGVLLPDCSIDPARLASTVGLDNRTWASVLEQYLERDAAWSRLERGEMALDDFVADLLELIGAAGGNADPDCDLRYLWWGGVPRERRLDPILHAAILHTQDRARHYLATNNILEYDHFWSNQIMDLPLSRVFNSCRMGTRKPEREFFQRISQELLVTGPEDSQFILIDDNRENCIAATGVGWVAVRFEDPAQCVDALMGLV